MNKCTKRDWLSSLFTPSIVSMNLLAVDADQIPFSNVQKLQLEFTQIM